MVKEPGHGSLLSARETAFIGLVMAAGIAESVLLARHHEVADGWHSIFDVGYGFGELARALREHGTYRICYGAGDGFWDHFWGHVCFSAHRLPFIPVFLAGLSFVSTDPVIGFIQKNLIFFTVSALAFVHARRHFEVPWVLVLLGAALFYLNPINAMTAAGLDFEEAYVVHLLPWVLLLLAKERRGALDIALFSAVLIAIILMKSSLLYLSVAALAVLAALERRHLRRVLPPVLGVAIAICGWGWFTMQESGRFAVGSDMSSINGWNLYKGNNSHTADYYPDISLDELDYDGLTKLPDELNDEWKINDEYKIQAIAFVKLNRMETAINMLKRAYVFFIYPFDIGHYRKNHYIGNISFTIVLVHVIVGISFVGLIGGLFQRYDVRRMSVTYLILQIFYVFPYIVGFAYARHVVPACGLAIFFILTLWPTAVAWLRRSPRRPPVAELAA